MGPQDVAADIHVRSAVLFHIGVAVKLEGRQQTVKVGGQRGSWSSLSSSGSLILGGSSNLGSRLCIYRV